MKEPVVPCKQLIRADDESRRNELQRAERAYRRLAHIEQGQGDEERAKLHNILADIMDWLLDQSKSVYQPAVRIHLQICDPGLKPEELDQVQIELQRFAEVPSPEAA